MIASQNQNNSLTPKSPINSLTQASEENSESQSNFFHRSNSLVISDTEEQMPYLLLEDTPKPIQHLAYFPYFLPCVRHPAEETSSNPWGWKKEVRTFIFLAASLYGACYLANPVSDADDLGISPSAAYFIGTCTSVVRIPFMYQTLVRFYPVNVKTGWKTTAAFALFYFLGSMPLAFAFIPTMRVGCDFIGGFWQSDRPFGKFATNYVVSLRLLSIVFTAPLAAAELSEMFTYTLRCKRPPQQQPSKEELNSGGAMDRLKNRLKMISTRTTCLDSFYSQNATFVLALCILHVLNSANNSAQGTDAYIDFLSEYIFKKDLSFLKVSAENTNWHAVGNTLTAIAEIILWLFQYKSTNSGYFLSLSFMFNKNNIRTESYATATSASAKRFLIASQVVVLGMLMVSGIGIFTQLLPAKNKDPENHYPDVLLTLCGGVYVVKMILGISAALFNAVFQYITPAGTMLYDMFENKKWVRYPEFQTPEPASSHFQVAITHPRSSAA